MIARPTLATVGLAHTTYERPDRLDLLPRALANNNKIALFRSVGATGLGRTTHQCASITDELTSTPTTAGPCDRGAAIFLRRSWETHKVEVVTSQSNEKMIENQ